MRIFILFILLIAAPRLVAQNTVASAAQNTAQESGCSARSLDSAKQALSKLFASLPHAIEKTSMQRIMKNPLSFFCDMQSVLKNTPQDIIRLVDKQHSIGNYAPSDLVKLDAHQHVLRLNKKDLEFRAVTLKPLLAMVRDASHEGITLLISSTYRSYEYQKKVFARNVKTLGRAQAERESARAGTSQHQLGLTIDFGCICPEFEKTRASSWLKEHAWKYGFSLSFPPNQEHITGYMFESWHYRYIGKDAAAFEKKYFMQGQQHVLEILEQARELLNL